MNMTKSSIQDSRQCQRLLVDPPIEGSFGGSRVQIVEVAQLGLRIEHPSPVRPGTNGLVAFRLDGIDELIKLRSEIVWSRLSRKATPEGKLLYRSGLRFLEANDSLLSAIELLVTADRAWPDLDSLERKRAKHAAGSPRAHAGTERMKVIRQRRRIDEGTVLLVRQALSFMRDDPVESKKWYNRAIYSLEEEEIPKLHHAEEVLAIWEYLERIVHLETIDWVLDNEHIV